VEVVTLNRPESKNSFSFALIKELGDHFQSLTLRTMSCGNHNRSGKGILYRGGPQQPDNRLRYRPAGGNAAHRPNGTSPGCRRHIRIWKTGDRPIKWEAAGGGLQPGLSCDILIASRRARFIQVFGTSWIDRGMGGTFFFCPASSVWRVPRTHVLGR